MSGHSGVNSQAVPASAPSAAAVLASCSANGTFSSQTPAPSHFIVGDPLNIVQYMNAPTWPADLRLDRSKSNWNEWSLRLTLTCDRQGFTEWLDETFPPPDRAADPLAHRVWTINDRSLKAFILLHVSQRDYKAVCDLPSSRDVFNELRKRHEKFLGPHTQILLLKQAMDQRFRPGVPLSQTLGEIDMLCEKNRGHWSCNPRHH